MSGSLSQLLHIELDYLNSKLKEIESELARCLEFKKKNQKDMSRANKTINRHYINIANCKNRIKTIGIGLKEIEWNKNYEQKNSTIKNRERQTNQSR